MYVVPGPRHPLLGDKTEPWLFGRFAATHPNRRIRRSTPTSTLVCRCSWSLWSAASGQCLVPGRRRRFLSTRTAGDTALVLGVVALAFSAPPKVSVSGVLIPMPYTIVQQATNVFRVAHRFSVLVMLAACILAALGLVALLRRRAVLCKVHAYARRGRLRSRPERAAVTSTTALSIPRPTRYWNTSRRGSWPSIRSTPRTRHEPGIPPPRGARPSAVHGCAARHTGRKSQTRASIPTCGAGPSRTSPRTALIMSSCIIRHRLHCSRRSARCNRVSRCVVSGSSEEMRMRASIALWRRPPASPRTAYVASTNRRGSSGHALDRRERCRVGTARTL